MAGFYIIFTLFEDINKNRSFCCFESLPTNNAEME